MRNDDRGPAHAEELIHLSDYHSYPWRINHVDLVFELDRDATRVSSRLLIVPNFAPNKIGGGKTDGNAGAQTPELRDLRLDGEDLSLKSVKLNGQNLTEHDYQRDDKSLVIGVDLMARMGHQEQILEIEVEISPKKNSSLMGLYVADGVFCTQCEPEGFRRIIYFPDRPDVMSTYRVKLIAAREANPNLLSNGNHDETGELDDGRHFAVWSDPHPKPCYLFALVAGQLDYIEDHFQTRDGRNVRCRVFVEPGKTPLARHALDSLLKAMAWDEERMNRVYDLDQFNIVAVSAFNFGAMENKGLNIFNDQFVLADSSVAIDQDFARIEDIVAHEYFHNWSGNRVTLANWFQICLKEGLTVFREQEFSSDVRERSVKRIADAQLILTAQMDEEMGPLSHPPRPESFKDINNFYTLTVYEKGAEIVRMIELLVGRDVFSRCLDEYFDANDGRAARLEDFIAAIEKVSGEDLTQFSRWWSLAGVPRVSVQTSYDAERQIFNVSVTQAPALDRRDSLAGKVAADASWLPRRIPISFALFNARGEREAIVPVRPDAQLERGLIDLLDNQAEYSFRGLSSEPSLSVLRGFSAPVILHHSLTREQGRSIVSAEDDHFARFRVINEAQFASILGRCSSATREDTSSSDGYLIDLLQEVLASPSDRSFKALLLGMPGEVEIASRIGADVDPDAVYRARRAVQQLLSQELLPVLTSSFEDCRTHDPDSLANEDVGKRSFGSLLLAMICLVDKEQGLDLARETYENAKCMTDRISGLQSLLRHGGDSRPQWADDFRERYAAMPLVMDRLHRMLTSLPGETGLQEARKLMQRNDFDLSNPNRVRAVLGTLGRNQTAINVPTGDGYQFYFDELQRITSSNSFLASGLLKCFSDWRRLEAGRRDLLEAHLLGQYERRDEFALSYRDILERVLAATK